MRHVARHLDLAGQRCRKRNQDLRIAHVADRNHRHHREDDGETNDAAGRTETFARHGAMICAREHSRSLALKVLNQSRSECDCR